MARPRIAPSARSVPISFSVKPHLAEKIEEYSHQLRFSRSKFLAQAVTEAINKIDLKHNLDDLDHRNFSDDRMLMLAKLRLDSAEEINPRVLQQLKDAIESFEARQPITGEFIWKRVSDKQFVNFGDHNADFRRSDGSTQSTALTLTKKGRKWLGNDPRYRTAPPLEFKTLAEAKERLEELYLVSLQEGR